MPPRKRRTAPTSAWAWAMAALSALLAAVYLYLHVPPALSQMEVVPWLTPSSQPTQQWGVLGRQMRVDVPHTNDTTTTIRPLIYRNTQPHFALVEQLLSLGGFYRFATHRNILGEEEVWGISRGGDLLINPQTTYRRGWLQTAVATLLMLGGIGVMMGIDEWRRGRVMLSLKGIPRYLAGGLLLGMAIHLATIHGYTWWQGRLVTPAALSGTE